ncbi:MAG: mechanosensitive ion channel family protein [Vicingaceae bacterium]
MDFKFDNDHLINIALAAGAVLFLILVIYGINKVFNLIYKKIFGLAGDKIKGLSLKNYQFLTPEYTAKLIVGGFKILRLLILLIVFYFWLPLLFSIFPWTKDISDALIGYTIDPLKTLGTSFINYLPSLFFIVIVFIIVRYINKVIKFFAKEITNERLKIDGFYKEWAKPTSIIVKLIVYVFAIVLVFPYLPGSDSPAFQGVSIFMGVLLSLGSTGFVANAVGGLMIIYMRPFIIGDVVKIGDNVGTVISKGMLVTRLNTPKNEEISVPNKMVVEHQIVNYSSEEKGAGVFMHTTVTIGYDVEWRLVHQVMIEAATRTEDILEDPKPFVLQTALNDFSVAYELNAYSKNPARMGAIYSELHQNLQDCFNENGIEILSPHYRVERVINESTIPEKYRKG